MTDFTFKRWLCVLNIVIALVLLSDTFYFPSKRQSEIVSFVETYVPKTIDGNISYAIHTNLKHAYRIPEVLSGMLNPGDVIVVYKTAIIGKAVEIEYTNGSNIIHVTVGILNNYFCRLLTAYILVVSLFFLIKYDTVEEVNIRERFIFSSSMIAFILVGFYLLD